MKIGNIKYASFAEMQGEFPEILYKYRIWDDDNHKNVISKRQLFYSQPSSFKDPIDCRSVIRYDLLYQKEKIEWIELKNQKK